MGDEDLNLTKSLIIGLLTILVVSQALSQYIIQPLTYDGTLVRTGRYSFTLDFDKMIIPPFVRIIEGNISTKFTFIQ